MTDPYKIMELTPSATDEEIKQAYRRLAKKYHPDLNPGNQEATDKMQKINAAYEQIKAMRQGGGSAYGGQPGGGTSSGQQNYGPGGNPFGQGGNPFGQNGNPFGPGGNPFGQGNPFGDGDFYKQFNEYFGRSQQQQRRHTAKSPRMQAVFHFLENRQYLEALRLLSEIERDGEWFFASAIANAGTGNRVTALNHAQQAVQLDPGNDEYLSLLEQFQQGSFAYRQSGEGHGFDMTRAARSMMNCCALQMVCLCCCRPC